MKVYVENVIIDNMVFDCILLALTAFTLRQKIVWWRILLGGVIGTALVFPVTLIDCIYAQYVIKLCSLTLMNLVNTTKLSFKRFIWSTLFFVAYTFILGGAIIGLFFLLGIDFTKTSTFNYISDIPIGLYALAVALIAYLAFAIRKYTLEKKKRSAFLCKCRVTVSDKVVECDGYFDSGNTLMHLETPVCFSTSKSLTRLLSEVLAESVLHSDGRASEVFFTTISGETSTLAYKTTISIEGNTSKIYLAPSKQSNIYYDILLCGVLMSAQDEVPKAVKTN